MFFTKLSVAVAVLVILCSSLFMTQTNSVLGNRTTSSLSLSFSGIWSGLLDNASDCTILVPGM